MSVGFVLRIVCVLYAVGSNPISSNHWWTIRAYCRVERCGDSEIRLGKRKSPWRSAAAATQSSKLFLVPAVTSNWTGCFVFCCITLARAATWPPWQTSLTRSRTKSHPRNLLSMAKLKSAKSRTLPKISRRTRIAQISLTRSGAFCPTNLPLLHGVLWHAEPFNGLFMIDLLD